MRALILMFFVSTCLFSCTFSKDESSNEQEQTGKEYNSAYICPMHCEGSGSDEPGECPVCGMKYRENPNHEHHKEGHMNHDSMSGEMHHEMDAEHESRNQKTHPQGMHQPPHDDQTYQCPMHPEITGKNGETCSKCGMPLEIVPEEHHEPEHKTLIQ